MAKLECFFVGKLKNTLILSEILFYNCYDFLLMYKTITIVRSVFNELLITFLLVFLLANVIGQTDKTINADGIGYYDYLPSIFIYHDLNRHNLNLIQSPEKFNRVNSIAAYAKNDGVTVNKYTCGTAILEFPFFAVCRITTDKNDSPDEGYQTPYHQFVFYAAVFYLFLALFFLKKILALYSIDSSTIVLAQLLLVFGTTVTDYVSFDASFSHIYSLFAITAFVYFVKKYFEIRSFGVYLSACIFLGLIILIRPINGMAVFIIPFLAGSFSKFKEEALYLFSHLSKTLLGILILLVIMAIQPLLWYLQTGQWLIYTFKGVGFNFLKPEILNVLFSYRKGLFIYTPVLLLCLTALIWLLGKRRYYEFLSSFIFLAFLTYVISSWSIWDYGESFGLRTFVDYYSIFFILFAIMFDKLVWWVKILFLIPAIFLVNLNVVQTYQYKEYILHWSKMDKERYWEVFMKTEEKYKGLFWKWEFDQNKFGKSEEINLGDFSLPAHSESVLADFSTTKFKNAENIGVLQVRITNDFKDENDSHISLTIRDTSGKIVVYSDRYLIHFNEQGLNKYQAGSCNFILPQKLTDKEYNLKLVAYSGSAKLYIKDAAIWVFSEKSDQ